MPNFDKLRYLIGALVGGLLGLFVVAFVIVPFALIWPSLWAAPIFVFAATTIGGMLLASRW